MKVSTNGLCVAVGYASTSDKIFNPTFEHYPVQWFDDVTREFSFVNSSGVLTTSHYYKDLGPALVGDAFLYNGPILHNHTFPDLMSRLHTKWRMAIQEQK